MRGRSRTIENANVDLTPMLDVVFILLIFFIVTSTFIQEKAIGLESPPPEPTTSPSNDTAMLLYLDANNNVRLNGRRLDTASIPSGLARLRAENPNSALIIQASPQASTGLVIRLRDIAYAADIDRVNVVRSE
jgi:biopolymer transport protein ExbD